MVDIRGISKSVSVSMGVGMVGVVGVTVDVVSVGVCLWCVGVSYISD